MSRTYRIPTGLLLFIAALIVAVAAPAPPALSPPSQPQLSQEDTPAFSTADLADRLLTDTARPFRFPEGQYGKGELKYRNDVPVLVVEGTPEQIGAQVARLAVQPGRRVLNYPEDVLHVFLQSAFGGVLGKTVYKSAWSFFTNIADRMVPAFPNDYRAELESMISAGHIDPVSARVGNTMFDAKSKILELRKGFGCCTLFVEGQRSATGAPLYGRNLDFPTVGYLNEYSLVTVYRQNGKHAFASVGFPGFIGCLSGMNDAGLTVAVLEVYSTREDTTDFDEKGTPYALCVRRLLEDCTTIEEAEKALRAMKRTTILNLAVGDRKHSAVFEFTPKSVVVRPSEDEVCICTNHFRTKELATSLTCWRYNRLCRCEDKMDLESVQRHLHSASQSVCTLQTMIFEPEALRLHLGIGKCPTSLLPLKTVELKELFRP